MRHWIVFLRGIIHPIWFRRRCVPIDDATQHDRRPFTLWPAQRCVLARIQAERKLAVAANDQESIPCAMNGEVHGVLRVG